MVDSLDRIETAIQRLTDVSVELKSMIAVHDQRINQQEKDTGIIFKLLEARRKELDDKINEVYVDMSNKDNNILEQIAEMRKESAEQHKALNEKITQLEKFIWIATGGGMVLVWVLSNIANVFKVFH
jgi:hypothetical protein